MVERSIGWLTQGNRRVRYRVTKNDHWLHHRLRRELPVLISVGISLALGLAIDGSDHKVRLASTRFHSPLANP